MAVCLSFSRLRARDIRLLAQVRRVAAYALSKGIKTHVRWVPSEHNPSDDSSRWLKQQTPVAVSAQVSKPKAHGDVDTHANLLDQVCVDGQKTGTSESSAEAAEHRCASALPSSCIVHSLSDEEHTETESPTQSDYEFRAGSRDLQASGGPAIAGGGKCSRGAKLRRRTVEQGRQAPCELVDFWDVVRRRGRQKQKTTSFRDEKAAAGAVCARALGRHGSGKHASGRSRARHAGDARQVQSGERRLREVRGSVDPSGRREPVRLCLESVLEFNISERSPAEA